MPSPFKRCLSHACMRALLLPLLCLPVQAPEVISGGSATAASDAFSFGVVMWELLTFRLPWEGTLTWQVPNVVFGLCMLGR